MLTILGGKGGRFCDGMSRRSFLQIGTMALGGLTLTDLLAAEAQAGVKSSHKATIVVYLPGGPPHHISGSEGIDAAGPPQPRT